MTKLLNVDALSSEQRTLEIGGVQYVVNEMNVENFIATTKDAEMLQDSNAPLTAQVESAVALVQRSVPDCPREILMRVPLRHLQVIVGFVRGDEVEAMPEAETSEPGTGKQPSKKRARK